MNMVEVMWRLCNNYQWFTCGTNNQYEVLFDMVRAGRRTKDLALVIFICSNGWLEEDIYMRLVEAGFPR